MNANSCIRFGACWLALLVFSCLTVWAAPLAVLHTKTETYQNVTLVNQTATHAFVQHSKGFASIKLSQLDPEELSALGIKGAEASRASTSARADQPSASATSQPSAAETPRLPISDWARNMVAELKSKMARKPGSGNILLMVLGLFAVVFLFFSYTAKLICEKAGTVPGILVWIPVFQMIPLLRAASMSAWWFLALFIPFVGFVVHILWCFKLSAARGKGLLTGICLILPGLSFFAWLYLAFSDSGSSADSKGGDAVKSRETEPLPA